MDQKLKKQIMRRVYAAYAIRIALSARVRYALLTLLAGVGLWKLVSVADVLKNFSRASGHAGEFIMGAFLNADAATLLVLALFAYGAVAFMRSGRMHIESPRFA
jgi:hypothetical protein